MKTTVTVVLPVILVIGLLAGGCSKKNSPEPWSLDKSKVSAQLKSFVAEKEAQANAAAKTDGQEMPPEFKTFFAAAQKGDWLAVSNTFVEFRKHAGQYEHSGKTDERLRGTAWQAVLETWGALYSFNVSGEKYSTAFGNGIIESIPPGSIYFGGTDPGRFLVTAMCKSHVNADPFFLLTQNALADGTYLAYLRGMYGEKIYTPTDEDSQRCFGEYMEDVKRRLMHDQQFPKEPRQIRPGEDPKFNGDKIAISGQTSVMAINGLLVKVVFDKNPDREFYIEESFPLDWMYPYLEPHDLIMKINRQPLTEMSDEIVKQDHDYWTKNLKPMIGDWLNADTSVGEVAAFAERVYANHSFSGFKGDLHFIESSDAQKMFSKLRSSIGGLYAWRAQHTTDVSERKRMNTEADFAFRQALALCPYSPEAVFRYVNLLASQNRMADALLVVETAVKMPSMQGRDGEQLRGVLKSLEQFRKAK